MYKCNIEGKTEVTEDIENNAIYKKLRKTENASVDFKGATKKRCNHQERETML